MKATASHEKGNEKRNRNDLSSSRCKTKTGKIIRVQVQAPRVSMRSSSGSCRDSSEVAHRQVQISAPSKTTHSA